MQCLHTQKTSLHLSSNAPTVDLMEINSTRPLPV
jgi:hypothetical protein